ncbi:hypothetical protein GYMLUDRAFT_34592 [Collybiopsis luxurians FD-317 M1]|nr:hypothetical protein GYMLUDRAFT_34592 [Collybiopsis luxurians FD-317 M1]
MERSSEDSDGSEFTDISAKTSIDTTTSISSVYTSLSSNSSLLQTNDQPSPQESLEIHALLDLKKRQLFELEQRKEVLDRQREILNRQSSLLDEELEDMTDTIDLYRGVIGCSMRKVPADLLLEIFQYYVADAECSSSLGSATVLTHVCRTWRQVALSSPILWTSLSVPHVTKQVVANISQRMDQVKAATGLPLDFDISLRKCRTDIPDADLGQLSSDILHAAVTQLHRWKTFSLHFDEGLSTFSRYPKPFSFPDISELMTAPNLESLDLAFHHSLSTVLHPVSQWTFSLIHSATVLRDLRLQLPGLASEALSTLSLPLLESLTIEVPIVDTSALLGLLRDAAPSLKELKVQVAGLILDDDLSSASMIIHPSLQTFELRVSHGGSGEAMSQFFDNLTLPSAREVVFEMGHFPESTNSVDFSSSDLPEDLELSWPHDSFLGFLERTSSCVTSLCLGFNSSPSNSSTLNVWDNVAAFGAELEEEHVQAYLALDNVADSLSTLHVKRDKPVWPELLEYLTLPSFAISSALRRPSTSSMRSARSRSSRLASSPLRKLENVALDIDPIFQVGTMQKFVKSRWYDGPTSSSYSFARLRSFAVTLCFPDLPNLDLESSATRKVFARIAQSPEDKEMAEGKLDVTFHRRTYSMMPMDVPTLGSELTI